MAPRFAGRFAAAAHAGTVLFRAVLAGTALAGLTGAAMAPGNAAAAPSLAAIDSAATPNTQPSASRPPLPGESLAPAPDSAPGDGEDTPPADAPPANTPPAGTLPATPGDGGSAPAAPAATPGQNAPGPNAPEQNAPGQSAPAVNGPGQNAPQPPAATPRPATGTPPEGSAAPSAPTTPAAAGEGEDSAAPADDSETDNTPLPPVHYGVEGLPAPVQHTRQAIIDAARTGDIEKLRAVIQARKPAPQLSRRPYGDPIAFLKENSGDEAGREILAILLDLLESGWVVTDPGTPKETYVWPYFAVYPIGRLTPAQQVEVLRVLTASDVDEMTAYDAYLFFKIGIAPDGTWRFFMADDGED
ncbi:hypothetical protein [Pseudoxanthobacter sp.]|uniref:hypothetical protein n=1 Tax=Pseudoxanthobacter sp. TaxID=1925742 RepID=UPI002FDF125C